MNSQNKIILYAGGFIFPDRNAAAQRVIGVGKALRSLGYEIDFFSVDNASFSTATTNELIKLEDGFFYKAKKYPISKQEWINYLSSIKDIENFINIERDKRISAVIVYNYPAIALYRLIKLCRRLHIPLYADCTEWYSTRTGNILFRIIKFLDTSIRMRILHKKVNGVICISRYLYDYYKKFGMNVLHLPPLVDLEDSKWKQNVKKSNKICRFIYAGSPGLEKGINKDRIDIVLEAFGRLVEEGFKFELEIVGLSENDYKKQSDENSKILFEISKYVNFKGRLQHKIVLKQLMQADFMIFLRNKRRFTIAGFPTKLVEAISSGTPVITNENSNVTDYIINNKNGLICDSLDINDIIDVIKSAIKMPNRKLQEMSTDCRDSSLFDYKNYIDSVCEFLRENI